MQPGIRHAEFAHMQKSKIHNHENMIAERTMQDHLRQWSQVLLASCGMRHQNKMSNFQHLLEMMTQQHKLTCTKMSPMVSKNGQTLFMPKGHLPQDCIILHLGLHFPTPHRLVKK